MRIPTRMICSICGKVHKFDFEVPNEMWEECIIERFRKSPVCLECFTLRADERLLKWDEVLKITVPCSLATQIEIQDSIRQCSICSNSFQSHRHNDKICPDYSCGKFNGWLETEFTPMRGGGI